MEDNNKINENTEEIFRSVMFKSLPNVAVKPLALAMGI